MCKGWQHWGLTKVKPQPYTVSVTAGPSRAARLGGQARSGWGQAGVQGQEHHAWGWSAVSRSVVVGL